VSRESRFVRLPVAPSILKRWVMKKLKNPKENTWIKVALLIEYLKKKELDPKHSSPGHFEISALRTEGMFSRLTLKTGKGIRAFPFLIELGLIEKVAPHRASIVRRAIMYRFKTKNFESYEIEVPRNLADKFNRLSKKKPISKTHDWIEQSLNRLTLLDSQIARLKADKGHRDNIEKFTRGNRKLGVTRSIYLNHCVVGLPKKTRANLRIDGEAAVACLDISGAHPVVLPWLIEDTLKAAKKTKGEGLSDEEVAELALLRNCLSESDFYLGLMPNEKRKHAKKTFLSSLNGADFPKALEVAKALAEKCPISGRVIRCRRFKNGTAFADELQGRVTEIILSVAKKCMKAGIPCLPVSDELIVPLPERFRVLEWMHEEIFEMTGVKAEVDHARMT